MTTTLNLVNRAMDHHRRGQLAEAEAGYRDVLRRDPNNADALHLLGLIIGQAGDAQHGIALIERSLKTAPSSAEAHFNLANLLAGLLRFSDAERHFRDAYRLRPDNAEAANGVGGSLLRLGDYDQAETWLAKALEVDPRCVSALVNMGTLMDATGRFGETIAYYDRALAVQPGYDQAHRNKALALLARGRLDQGWPAYACRFKTAATFHGKFPIPYWRGENLFGRKILVWTEQGLGDEILAVSMIPDLLQAGAHVVLICSPRLRQLLSRSFPTIDIIPTGGQPEHGGVMADLAYQASVSHLGEVLRPSLEAFPRRGAYLKPDAALTSSLRNKYKTGAGTSRLVGISWRSSTRDGGQEKSISLLQCSPILRTPGITFVNLQYGDTHSDIAVAERELGVKILSDPDINPLGDLSPVASQIAALDLVVSVSNTAAHVAGAVGAQAWTLVPTNTSRLWYWFLERADSPWYPTLRLFRQDGRGWEQTITDVATALASCSPIEIAG
jgi:tetratricopeptide (TPR) repeat protein